jgi:hypothetical protein
VLMFEILQKADMETTLRSRRNRLTCACSAGPSVNDDFPEVLDFMLFHTSSPIFNANALIWGGNQDLRMGAVAPGLASRQTAAPQRGADTTMIARSAARRWTMVEQKGFEPARKPRKPK